MKSLKVASLLAFTSIIRGKIGVILLTVFILVLAALNLLFVPSLLNGLVWGANDKLINTYSADLIIDSEKDQPLIQNAGDIVKRIEEIGGVVAVAPRNSMGAELKFESRRMNCVVYGIQPEKEQRVFRISQSLIEGDYLNGNDRDSILLGIELAGADRPNIELYSRSLRNVHAGDKVTVTYTSGREKSYTVKGIFYTEFIQTDLQAFVSEREFQSVNPRVENGATTIYVKTAANADRSSIIEDINRLRSGLRVLTWEDYAGIVRSMTESFNVIDAILNVVNLLVAGVTIFIVTYIDVEARRRQIGIQRAIGITPTSITSSYLMRALFYGLVAVVLAWLIFIYIITPFEARYPFHFPFGDVYLRTGLPELLRTAVILLGVSIIASLIPVRNVMRVRIIDAIWR